MNDSQMHNLQSYMANQYISTKPDQRLHMSRVLLSAKAKRHQKEKQAHLVGLMAALASGMVFVPLAYLERGYLGVGSEWIMVVVAYMSIKRFWR